MDLSRETAALQRWLSVAEPSAVVSALSFCWPYAVSHGPIRPWLDAAARVCRHPTEHRRNAAWAWGRLAFMMGDWQAMEEAAAILEKSGEGARDQALAMSLRADVHQSQGRLDQALKIRENEITAYQNLRDVRSMVTARTKVVEILTSRSEYEKALEICRKELLPLADELQDDDLKGGIHSQMVTCLRVRGDYDEALEILRGQAVRLDDLGDVRSKAVVMGSIADIYRLQGKFEDAMKIRIEEEIPVFKRVGDVKGHALAMGKVATLFELQGKRNDAMKIRRDVELPVYQQLGDVAFAAAAWQRIGDIHCSQGDRKEALRIYEEEVIPAAISVGDVRLREMTMVRIADIHRDEGNLPAALELLRNALGEFERMGDKHSSAATNGKIATILCRQGDFTEARRLYREVVLPAFDALKDPRGKMVALCGWADVLQEQGELDEALRIRCQEVLPVCEQLRDLPQKTLTLEKISIVFQIQGKLREALKIRREQVLPAYERMGDQPGRARVEQSMAHVTKHLDDDLQRLREEALPFCEKVGDVEGRLAVLDRISSNYLQREDFDGALGVLREEVLPIREGQGGDGLLSLLICLGTIHRMRGRSSDLVEARVYLRRAEALANSLGSSLPAYVVQWLASEAGR